MLERFDEKEKFGISTESATLGILKDSLEIYLTQAGDDIKLERGKLIWHSKEPFYWEVTFLSPLNERIYGIGNPQMGRSGRLMKSFAQTTVGNGVTQAPFFFSTAGYGMLVDFEKKGAQWKRSSGRHYWRVPDKVLDFYLFLGDTPYQILDSYTDLTGRPPIPPIWSFGFMMSRWGYSGWEDIRQKWHTFRQKNIPVDVFIYDYDWFVKDWQWNDKAFPNPEENLKEASKLGIKIVGIRKPRVEDKENFRFAKSKGWILAHTKNDLDFSIPEVRSWWWGKHVPVFKDGMAGWWNDEAEQTMTEYHYMIEAERDGMLAEKPNKRVWTINRAFSPGMQRLGAAVWTGDINSSWEDLENQPGSLLNYSMTGMPYGSQDIGGFIGLPSPEMYTRWIQQGVFVPVMRAHSQQHSDRWPWAFGLEAEKAVRKAIELRYRLIPYFYSYAREASQNGAPLMRPLFFEFPGDPQTFEMEDEWLVGREILVAPILNPGGARKVYLPAGTWYDFSSGRPIEGPITLSIKAELDEIPVYVREGSILPLGPIIQHTGGKAEIPLDIHVYPGKDANFLLYEDDGETYAYRKGQYGETLLQWKQAGYSLAIKPSIRAYKGAGTYLISGIYIHNVDKPLKVALNGKDLPEIKDKLSKKPGWFYAPASRKLRIVADDLNLNHNALLTIDPETSRLLLNSDSAGLTALLEKRKGQLCNTVLWALAEIGDKQSLAVLKESALKDMDSTNRKVAIEAINAYGIGDAAFFKQCLKDSSPPVRFSAIKALQELGAEADVFEYFLGDYDESVQLMAHKSLEVLAAKGDCKAINILIKKLKAEKDINRKVEIINALAPSHNQEVIFNEFRKLLQTPHPVIQELILKMIKGYGVTEGYFDSVAQLAFDKNKKIATLAQEALRSYPKKKAERYFGTPIRTWKAIGPFDNRGGHGFAKAYPPEKKVDLRASCPGLTGQVKWRTIGANNEGIINLLKIFPEKPEDVCAYALVVIESKREMEVQLWMGSDDDIKVWLNGKTVWSKKIGRMLKKDEDKVKVKLKEGNNLLLVKVCQGWGAWEYIVRLVDQCGRLNEVSYFVPK